MVRVRDEGDTGLLLADGEGELWDVPDPAGGAEALGRLALCDAGDDCFAPVHAGGGADPERGGACPFCFGGTAIGTDAEAEVGDEMDAKAEKVCG